MSDYTSYKSPVYDALDDQTTQKLGLPDGLLQSIRLNGERTNANQVSSAGAKTVYQFIPATRNAILNKYGTDVYLNPQNASMGAGLLLNESLKRNNGDVNAAVSEYHGGTNKSNWGPLTKSYANRVLSAITPTAQADEMPDASNAIAATSFNPDAYLAKQQNLSQPIASQDNTFNPDAYLAANTPTQDNPEHPHPTQQQLDAAHNPATLKQDLQQTLADNPIAAKMAAFADPVMSLYEGAKQLFGANNNQDVQNVQTIHDANPMSALAGNVATYAVGGAAAPVLNTMKGAAATGAASGFLNPTQDNSITDRLLHAGEGAAAGAIGTGIANKAGSYIDGVKNANLAQQSANLTRDTSLKNAVNDGYTITPSLAGAGIIPRTVEGLTGSARAARTAMDNNQLTTNALANDYLGLPKNVALSDSVIDSLKEPHNAVYEQVAQLPDTVIGQSTNKSSGTGAIQSTPIIANGRDLLDQLKEARDTARSAWKGFNSGMASNPTELMGIAKNADAQANTLENNLQQIALANNQPDLVNQLRDSRVALAKINTIDKVMNDGTGDVNAMALAKLQQNGAPLDGGAAKIANFARAFGKVARVPADGNSAPFTAVDAGLMGGGLGAANPALAALPLGRLAGRSAILSQPVQNAMANKDYGLNLTQQFTNSILASKYAPLGIAGGLLNYTK